MVLFPVLDWIRVSSFSKAVLIELLKFVLD